jgi:hypothetical protein
LRSCSHASIAGADCFTNARGDTVCGKGKCEADQYQKVYCAQAGGMGLRDSVWKWCCGGKGSCSPDSNGKLWCFEGSGGGAATDSAAA